jgi:hypothetical protein
LACWQSHTHRHRLVRTGASCARSLSSIPGDGEHEARQLAALSQCVPRVRRLHMCPEFSVTSNSRKLLRWPRGLEPTQMRARQTPGAAGTARGQSPRTQQRTTGPAAGGIIGAGQDVTSAWQPRAHQLVCACCAEAVRTQTPGCATTAAVPRSSSDRSKHHWACVQLKTCARHTTSAVNPAPPHCHTHHPLSCLCCQHSSRGRAAPAATQRCRAGPPAMKARVRGRWWASRMPAV